MAYTVYAATIGLSAFLLFLVQPMTAKMILPLFGGGAAVWLTCVTFFQVLLFAGYASSHWVVAKYPFPESDPSPPARTGAAET